MENIADFKIKLETLEKEVVEELNNIAVLNSESGDWEVSTDGAALTESDPSIQGDAAEEADTRITILSELETKWRAIKLAQTKIAAGTFGICEISGETIETARLQINPAARTCTQHMNEEYNLPL